MKVLIVKLSALGDVLSSTPFFRLIKERHPDWEVHHLVMRHSTEVTASNPWVDRQIIVDLIPSGNYFKDLKYLSSLWYQLIRERYHMAVLFHRNVLFQLLCKSSGINNLVGFESFNNFFLSQSIPYLMNVNRTLQEHRLLKVGGIEIDIPNKLEFYPNKKNCDQSLLESLPKQFIVINPGGGNPHAPADNRFWPIENYASLINRSSIPVVVLGKGEKDKMLVDKLNRIVPDRFLNFVGKTNLHESAEILKRAELYIGNDSSLLYLGAAMGICTLGLFGPTQTVAANPLGHKQFFLRGDAPCAPCYNPFDNIKGLMYTCKDNICMQNISVESVREKLNKLLR